MFDLLLIPSSFAQRSDITSLSHAENYPGSYESQKPAISIVGVTGEQGLFEIPFAIPREVCAVTELICPSQRLISLFQTLVSCLLDLFILTNYSLTIGTPGKDRVAKMPVISSLVSLILRLCEVGSAAVCTAPSILTF